HHSGNGARSTHGSEVGIMEVFSKCENTGHKARKQKEQYKIDPTQCGSEKLDKKIFYRFSKGEEYKKINQKVKPASMQKYGSDHSVIGPVSGLHVWIMHQLVKNGWRPESP